MIRINYLKKEKNIIQISIKGHANFAELGSDIVCASVSSIFTTSINATLKINPNSLKYVDNYGEFIISNIIEDKTIQIIIDNMIELLTELATQYPKNIKIRIEGEK